MPHRGKSRRVAARQTQQGQKKKRPNPGPSGSPAIAAAAPVKVGEDGPKPRTERPTETSIPQPFETQRPYYPRQAESRTSVYSYVRPELARILGFSGVILAILIALTFVLR